MYRTATVIFICFMSTQAMGAPIKLSCAADIRRDYPTGKIEKDYGTIIIHVENISKNTFITGDGPDISINVATKKIGEIVDIIDFSDKGKWDITNTVSSSGYGTWVNRVIIDRNTGDFNFDRSRSDSEGIILTASGHCKKVNMSHRKF